MDEAGICVWSNLLSIPLCGNPSQPNDSFWHSPRILALCKRKLQAQGQKLPCGFLILSTAQPSQKLCGLSKHTGKETPLGYPGWPVFARTFAKPNPFYELLRRRLSKNPRAAEQVFHEPPKSFTKPPGLARTPKTSAKLCKWQSAYLCLLHTPSVFLKPRDPNINSSIFLGKLAKLALANKVRHCESSKKAWTSCHRTPAIKHLTSPRALRTGQDKLGTDTWDLRTMQERCKQHTHSPHLPFALLFKANTVVVGWFCSVHWLWTANRATPTSTSASFWANWRKQGPSLWVFEKSLDLVPQNSCHKTSYESQGPTNWTGQARHRHMGPENDARTMQAAYSLPSSPLCTSVQGKHSGCWVTLFCTLALNGKPRDPNINSSIFLGKLAKLALANKVRHCESSKKAWTSCHRTPAIKHLTSPRALRTGQDKLGTDTWDLRRIWNDSAYGLHQKDKREESDHNQARFRQQAVIWSPECSIVFLVARCKQHTHSPHLPFALLFKANTVVVGWLCSVHWLWTANRATPTSTPASFWANWQSSLWQTRSVTVSLRKKLGPRATELLPLK